MYSRSITNLIEALKKLPGVGARTAERYVFHLLKSGRGEVSDLRSTLEALLKNTEGGEVGGNVAATSPCPICGDTKRDHTTVCAVADPQDLAAIEQTGEYRGIYHVLRGTLDPSDEETLLQTKIRELIKRAGNKNGQIKEIILALNPDLAGETTAMFLENQIKNLNPGVRVSRLARGLPMGADLQYADEITLASALKNRK